MADLGSGRGWLNDAPAASIRRLDRALGHPLQITEAGRTWAQQNVHWLNYQRNGRPIALHPDTPSVHQKGAAIDTDEGQQHVQLLAEHGWKRTVYRWVNGRYTLVEPWHFEYFPDKDQHRNGPEFAGNETPAPVPEEDDMTLFRWNNLHVFGLGVESIYHVTGTEQYAELKRQHGSIVEVENDGFTYALLERGIQWDQVDAVLRGAALGSNGRYWSRLMAEGIAIRGAQAEQKKTLADVLATAKAIEKS